MIPTKCPACGADTNLKVIYPTPSGVGNIGLPWKCGACARVVADDAGYTLAAFRVYAFGAIRCEPCIAAVEQAAIATRERLDTEDGIRGGQGSTARELGEACGRVLLVAVLLALVAGAVLGFLLARSALGV